jgi:tetratricopeptide (TPR) repeat protein
MARAWSGLLGLGCCLVCAQTAGDARAFTWLPLGADAKSDLTRACREAAPHAGRGASLLAQKLYADAIEELRAALSLCPEQEDAGLDLARVYLAQRQFADAERAAQDVLKEHPRSESAQLLLANSYFMQEDFEDAGKTLQRLIAQDPQNAGAHKLMGLTLFFYKQDVMAEHELAEALRLKPDDNEALYYQGRVFYTQNNFGPAAEDFRKLIDRDPDYYKAYDNLALCYEAMGKIPDAAAQFKKAQKIAARRDPAYDWPYGNLAEMLIKQERAAEAIPYAERAVQINPGSARNEYLLGKALLRTGEATAAVAHLQRSIQLDASFAEPHYALGQAYQKLQELQQAEREFAAFEEVSKRLPAKRR